MSLLAPQSCNILKTTTSLLNVCRRCISHVDLYRPRRKVYALQHKVHVVNPDGSSVLARYHEPLGVIRLPLDPNSLTEEELKARRDRNMKDTKITIEDFDEEDEVVFDRRSSLRRITKK